MIRDNPKEKFFFPLTSIAFSSFLIHFPSFETFHLTSGKIAFIHRKTLSALSLSEKFSLFFFCESLMAVNIYGFFAVVYTMENLLISKTEATAITTQMSNSMKNKLRKISLAVLNHAAT